jgi:hypothetical protein
VESVSVGVFGTRKAGLKAAPEVTFKYLSRLRCAAAAHSVTLRRKPPELSEIEVLTSEGATRFGSVSPAGVKALATTRMG